MKLCAVLLIFNQAVKLPIPVDESLKWGLMESCSGLFHRRWVERGFKNNMTIIYDTSFYKNNSLFHTSYVITPFLCHCTCAVLSSFHRPLDWIEGLHHPFSLIEQSIQLLTKCMYTWPMWILGEIGLNVSFTSPDQKNQENHTASVKTSDIKNEKSEITMAITQIGFWVMMFLYNPRTINYSVLL